MTRAGLLQRLRQQISGPKTVELPISCYGKLPIYKDFLRENLASKHAQAFKHWLDKGIGHYWGANDVYRGETIYPHAFLLRFPGTARYVVGYLWGSHDVGDLRFFPFSVFASLPAGSREAFPPHAVLEILEPMIAAGRRWHHESAQLTSFEDFVKWSRGLTLEVTLKPEQAAISEILSGASALTMDDFAAGLWREGSDLEWPALLSYMDRHQERVKAHRHPTDLAVRLPSSGRLPLVLQAQYWTLIFELSFDRPIPAVLPANAGREYD
jgi:type VI secretion system ImpM family protein